MNSTKDDDSRPTTDLPTKKTDLYLEIMRRMVASCKHVILNPDHQALFKVLTKISSHTYTEPKNSLFTKRCSCSGSEILKIVGKNHSKIY